MKATPSDQARLLELQALDTRLARLAHAARTIPAAEALAAVGGESDALRREHVGALGSLEDARAELARAESDVALVVARVERDTARLAGSSSARDAAALENELASLATRRGRLEDVQLEIMERLEELESGMAGLDARRGELDARATALGAERDEAFAAIERDRDAALRDREAVATSVPDDLLALYDAQRTRHGTGASELVGRVSSATGVQLDGADLEAVRRAAPDDVLIDPESHAVLVRTERSAR